MYRGGGSSLRRLLRQTSEQQVEELGVMSASVFEGAFEREHALAIREARSFAMIVFYPTEARSGQQTHLARILKSRIRVSDCLGRLDSQRLAILLPETDERGAWALADELLAQIAKAELSFNLDVHAQPSVQRTGPRGDKPVGSNGTSNGKGSSLSSTNAPTPALLVEADGSTRRARLSRTSPVLVAEPSKIEGEQLITLQAIRQSMGERPVEDLSLAFCQTLSLRKRIFDCVVSLLLLILLSPVFLMVAVAIKLADPGPVFFRQSRAGLGGKPFAFYKFRTMRPDAEHLKQGLRARNEKDGPIFKMQSDPRVTALGRILRRCSIDELPQLWNVLRGEMSLVGPRPPTLDEVEQYEPWQRQRLSLTGGLTCIWQVNGRSEIGFQEWVRMDIRYARKRGPLFDLKLLARTVGAVLSRRGAF